jgi:hypothetical protein
MGESDTPVWQDKDFRGAAFKLAVIVSSVSSVRTCQIQITCHIDQNLLTILYFGIVFEGTEILGNIVLNFL